METLFGIRAAKKRRNYKGLAIKRVLVTEDDFDIRELLMSSSRR